MASLPTFAAGTRSKIVSAIENGILKYPSYVFCYDDNHFIFVDKNLQMQDIVGNNPKSVQFVTTELSEITDASKEVLYIKDGTVYLFDGENFNPMYNDVSKKLETLTKRVDELEKRPHLVFDSKESFPEVGEDNILYIATNEPDIYIWNVETNTYVSITSSTSTIQWIEL